MKKAKINEQQRRGKSRNWEGKEEEEEEEEKKKKKRNISEYSFSIRVVLFKKISGKEIFKTLRTIKIA